MPADRIAEPMALAPAEDADIAWIVAQEARDDFAAFIHAGCRRRRKRGGRGIVDDRHHSRHVTVHP